MLKQLDDYDLPDMEEMTEAVLPGPGKRERIAPVLYGIGLLAVGAALLKLAPGFGKMPGPVQYRSSNRSSKRRKAASFVRDGAEGLSPSNVTDKIGKSLMIGGTAMIAARILDEALERR